MKRVLVIGDIIEDVYRECHFKKMCPDAPTAKALVQSSVDVRPGGAANVAVNLAALAPDIMVDLIGVMNSDLAAKVKQLSQNRVSMEYVELTSWPGDHLQKERILLEGETVVRLDNRSRVTSFMRGQVGKLLRDYLAYHDPDLVIMSDYDGGTLYGEDLTDDANLQILLGMKDRLLVDTKITDLSVFQGTLLAKLNASEWERTVMTEPAPERFFDMLVVTRGERGADLVIRRQISPGKSVTHTITAPAPQVQAVDVCGCGDTFLAGLAAMMLRNPDPYTAIQFANAAACTVVTKPRTAVADRETALSIVGRTDEAR